MGAARHHQRRLHPHHRAPPLPGGAAAPAARLRQRRHRARHLRGPLLRVVRGLLHRGRAGRRQLPDPRPPGRVTEARRTTSSSCQPLRATAARLVRGAPRRRAARDASATRRSASSARACRTSRSPARRSTGACRCRGTPSHVFYVWYDALHQLRHRRRLRHRPRARSTRGGRASTTSSARTSSASTASTGRRCCWRPGSSRPQRVYVHGCLLVGGEKMSKTRLNQIAPADLVADFGVDGFRYHFLARRRRSAPTATSPTRGWWPATTPTWPTTSATCCRRVATVVDKKCGGIGPAPRPTARSRPVAADGLRGGAPRRGTASQPSRGAGGHVAAHPGDQRPPRGQRAVEGRARARRSTPCSATPSRRCASSPSSPRRPSRRRAEEIWRRIGLGGSVGGPAPARRRGVGRLPGRAAGREGRAALPPPQRCRP